MQRIVVEHEGAEEIFGITHVQDTTFMVYRNTDPKNIKRVFVEEKLTEHDVLKIFGVEDVSFALRCAEEINKMTKLEDQQG